MLAGSNRTVFNLVRDAWLAHNGGGAGGKRAAMAADDDDDEERAPTDARTTALKDAVKDVTELQIRYMAFDILYDGDHSVIHLDLLERTKILANVIDSAPEEGHVLTPPGAAETICGGVFPVVHGSPWSRPLGPNTAEEVLTVLKLAIEKGEEGVVFKDPAGKWQKGDRSHAWIKFKPEYLQTDDLVRALLVDACLRGSLPRRSGGADPPLARQDLLIIGAFRGTGKRGGKVSQFLLGLAEKPFGGGEPNRFITFCKARAARLRCHCVLAWRS